MISSCVCSGKMSLRALTAPHSHRMNVSGLAIRSMKTESWIIVITAPGTLELIRSHGPDGVRDAFGPLGWASPPWE